MNKIIPLLSVLCLLLFSIVVYNKTKLSELEDSFRLKTLYANRLEAELKAIAKEKNELQSFKDSVYTFAKPYERRSILPPIRIEENANEYESAIGF